MVVPVQVTAALLTGDCGVHGAAVRRLAANGTITSPSATAWRPATSAQWPLPTLMLNSPSIEAARRGMPARMLARQREHCRDAGWRRVLNSWEEAQKCR